MTKTGRILFSATLGTAGCLLLIIGGSFRPVTFFRMSAIYALRPLASFAASVRRAVMPGGSVRREALSDQKDQIAAKEAELIELRKENESLRAALTLKDEADRSLIAARVWWYANDEGRETLVIDKGKNQEVHEGDPVMDENRMLVGDVAETGHDFSKVNIASNPGTAFAVTLVSGEEALMRGLGARSFSVEFVPDTAPARVGDFAVKTLKNIRGIKPIFAGRIADARAPAGAGFRTLSAVLAARPERLERVWVMTIQKNL